MCYEHPLHMDDDVIVLDNAKNCISYQGKIRFKKSVKNTYYFLDVHENNNSNDDNNANDDYEDEDEDDDDDDIAFHDRE